MNLESMAISLRSLVQMIRRVGNITILTNTTTAIRFCYIYVLTSSKDLRQFGLVASLNIFAVFHSVFIAYTHCISAI